MLRIDPRALMLAIGLLFLPRTASAHSFGMLYNLPVPFGVYLFGGAITLIITFLMIGYFYKAGSQNAQFPESNLSRFNVITFLTSRPVLAALRATTVALFLLAILTGLIGNAKPYSNFNMTFFWIIFVLGLTYSTAVIGNIYLVLNPWRQLLSSLPNKTLHGLIAYPLGAGYYPALLFYILLIWFELIGETSPFRVSVMLAAYTLINAAGVVAFGLKSWFQYCELFSVFFRLIGKLAPVEFRSGHLYLRPPFVGLLRDPAEHFSLLLFVLFMLSSTAFDGFKETIPWVRFYWFRIHGPFSSAFDVYQTAYDIFDTAGLVLSLFLFLAIYLVFVALAKVIARSPSSTRELALRFAFSLVPIALAYNLAHYYPLMFTLAPNIISLLSDPFGFGWNLFGTATNDYRSIPAVHIIWHSQVAFIVLGHMVSVYIAHVVALEAFHSQKKALLTQFPMLLLMVVYTMIGLWILAQPITAGTADMLG